MHSAISIQHISKHYGALQALNDVSLTIEPGEFFGLLGPNGAGKTTLISILAGLVNADRGHASILGADVQKSFRDARRMLGVVPQELVFDPFFTVRETLRFQSGYFGIRNNDAWIDEIMANLDLTGKADSNMRALSGGMKRRVLVAQALVHRPPVIILDEPTAGLDPAGRKELMAMFKQLHENGLTIVLVTHLMDDVADFADFVYVLEKGKVVLSGQPSLVFQNVDFMESIQLGVPKITKFAAALDRRGFVFENLPITLEEFTEVIAHG